MTYVVTFTDVLPTPRYDGHPWTQVRFDEAPASAGPFVQVDLQGLTPLDGDPSHPQLRNLTTALATLASGWYRLAFIDAAGNQEITDPVARGIVSPAAVGARDAVRNRIRDAGAIVRLEELSDQIPQAATPTQTVFQVRFEDVPTQRYMNANVVPRTLVAYVDNAWAASTPTVDVDVNGNFALATPPISRLLITYQWQYLADAEIDQYVDEARQWLREFSSVALVPDGLVPALLSYASSRALSALQRSATLARVQAGDSAVDWSALATAYGNEAQAYYKIANDERTAYYTQGPEALDPTVADVSAPFIPPYTPLR